MPPPGRSRRRASDDDDGDGRFGDLTPWKNPPAVYAYRCAVIGLAPLVGLFTGWFAIVLGFVGMWRNHKDPHVGGYAHSRMAVGLGLFEILTNGAGLFFIAHGMGWV